MSESLKKRCTKWYPMKSSNIGYVIDANMSRDDVCKLLSTVLGESLNADDLYCEDVEGNCNVYSYLVHGLVRNSTSFKEVSFEYIIDTKIGTDIVKDFVLNMYEDYNDIELYLGDRVLEVSADGSSISTRDKVRLPNNVASMYAKSDGTFFLVDSKIQPSRVRDALPDEEPFDFIGHTSKTDDCFEIKVIGNARSTGDSIVKIDDAFLFDKGITVHHIQKLVEQHYKTFLVVNVKLSVTKRPQ